MKRYVIGIIAMMASLTVGCSDNSSEQLMDEPSRKPMTFVVDEEALTRLDNLDYINDVSQIWSFTVVAQVDGEIYQQGNFIYDQMSDAFVPANGEAWLWPGDESKEVTFYATNAQGWTQGISNSEPIVGDEYTFNNELGSYDMICAYTKVSRTNCQDGVVHLNFSHALAELGILVRGEFPDGVDISSYRIISIDIQGEYDQIYNFKSNTWSEKVDGDNIYSPYFAYENGFLLGDTNGSFVETLIYPQRQQDGDTFRFLQPGTYNIDIYYWQDNDGKFLSTTVTLVQGKKNRVLLTLPYMVPA